MSTLYIDRRDVSLTHDAGALVVRADGRRIGMVPLEPITRVVLRGNASLQVNLLGQLGARGIGVIVLSGRKGEPTLCLPRRHHDAHLRVAQARSSLQADFCLAQARRLVHDKLQGQRELLLDLRQTHAEHRYPLTRAAEQISQCRLELDAAQTLASLRGLEGAGASAYFAGLRFVVPQSLGFEGRKRRPPRDPLNALLSLTYTLLHAETALALHAAGLDPAIGFYHQLAYGRESLACDVVEPLRPMADRLCLDMFASQTLKSEYFSVNEQGCLLGKTGRQRYYAAYEEGVGAVRERMQAQVRQLAQALLPDKEFAAPLRVPCLSRHHDEDAASVLEPMP